MSAVHQYFHFWFQGNENYTGIAARDTANALTVLTGAVRGVAATTNDKNIQNDILDAVKDVIEKSMALLEEAKAAVNNANNPDNQARLTQVKGCPLVHHGVQVRGSPFVYHGVQVRGPLFVHHGV